MRTPPVLLTVLLTALLGSCGGGAEKKSDGAKKEAKTEDKSDEKADEKADEKTEEKAAPEPAAAASDIDCGKIVGSADIQQACGADTTMEVAKSEGRSPLATCSRKLRGPDNKRISVHLAIHESIEKASGLKWPEDAKPIADLGDIAQGYVAEKGGEFEWHTVEVRKGERVLYIRSINDVGADPLCSVEQLTDVAREAMNRL